MEARRGIRFFPVGGRRVAYGVSGEGPPLVAAAWWVSHLEHDWEDQRFRRFFEALGDGYRLVRYDRPGVGLSGRDALSAQVTIATASGAEADASVAEAAGHRCERCWKIRPEAPLCARCQAAVAATTQG